MNDTDVLIFANFYSQQQPLYKKIFFNFWINQYKEEDQAIFFKFLSLNNLMNNFTKSSRLYSHPNCTCEIDNDNRFYFKNCCYKVLKVNKPKPIKIININDSEIITYKDLKDYNCISIENSKIELVRKKKSNPIKNYLNFKEYPSFTEYMIHKYIKEIIILDNAFLSFFQIKNRRKFIEEKIDFYSNFKNRNKINRSDFLEKFNITLPKPKNINEIFINLDDFIIQYNYITPIYIYDKCFDSKTFYTQNYSTIKLPIIFSSPYKIITFLFTIIKNNIIILDIFRLNENLLKYKPQYILKKKINIISNIIAKNFNIEFSLIKQFNIKEEFDKYTKNYKYYNGIILKHKINFNEQYKFKFNNISKISLLLKSKTLCFGNNIKNDELILPINYYKYKITVPMYFKSGYLYILIFKDNILLPYCRIFNSNFKFKNTFKLNKNLDCFICDIKFNNFKVINNIIYIDDIFEIKECPHKSLIDCITYYSIQIYYNKFVK